MDRFVNLNESFLTYKFHNDRFLLAQVSIDIKCVLLYRMYLPIQNVCRNINYNIEFAVGVFEEGTP
jgi:hypothetical protein